MSDVVIVVEEAPVKTIELGGTQGPPGPQGPAGPPGGSGGDLATVTATSSIPVGQIFTRVNASVDCSVTLPIASTVFVAGISEAYTIKNISVNKVTILPTGSDLIEFGASADILFQYESLTLMATSSGWEII